MCRTGNRNVQNAMYEHSSLKTRAVQIQKAFDMLPDVDVLIGSSLANSIKERITKTNKRKIIINPQSSLKEAKKKPDKTKKANDNKKLKV